MISRIRIQLLTFLSPSEFSLVDDHSGASAAGFSRLFLFSPEELVSFMQLQSVFLVLRKGPLQRLHMSSMYINL
jgi:hypothetical protein